MKTNYFLSVVLVLVGLASFSQVNYTEEKSMVCNDKFRLDLVNKSGPSKQILVGYLQDCTLGFDKLYDGKIFGTNPLEFYSFVNDDINDTKLMIQGRPFPTLQQEEVALGFELVKGLSLENRIELTTVEGVFIGADILLFDKELSITHNLEFGPYEFTSIEGVKNDRFKIIFESNIFNTLGNNLVESESPNLFIKINDNVFTLTTTKDKIKSIKIYTLCGQLIYSKDFNGVENEIKIDSISPLSDVLIVRTVLSNGNKVIKKVFY